CPLTSVAIAPLVVRGTVVGALKLYRAGAQIDADDERVANGLARVFSVSLEAAELDAREALVTQAELDALRARISPHFLFNTLTTIAALTRNDSARAHRARPGAVAAAPRGERDRARNRPAEGGRTRADLRPAGRRRDRDRG